MYIPALVLQLNNDQYINGGVDYGTIKLIPTPESDGYVFNDYWAVPTSDNIVSGFQYTACAPDDAVKPDAQAFHVVRIQSSQTRDDWYVLGTSTDYIICSKSAECCESPAANMPTTVTNIAPCQDLCDNASGFAQGVFGLPSPDGGTYKANGFYNGAALPQVTGATAAALVTALNLQASWAAIGVWSKTSDNLTLLVISGSAAETPANNLCVLVTF